MTSTFKTGDRVRVTLPDTARSSQDEKSFEGNVRNPNIPCGISGLPGMEVDSDDGATYHIDPEWAQPI